MEEAHSEAILWASVLSEDLICPQPVVGMIQLWKVKASTGCRDQPEESTMFRRTFRKAGDLHLVGMGDEEVRGDADCVKTAELPKVGRETYR